MGWFRTRAGAAVGLTFVIAVMGACGGSKPAKTAGADSSGGGDSNKAGPAEVGKPAPELAVESVNGKGKISLDSLSGKVAIVDFWATWCGPCKQSFPKLEELSKKYAGKVQIVGVSVDDSKDGVADFAKNNGATFPIGWDDGHSIANRWKVGTMPTTYVLDATGTVRYIHDGYHEGEAETISKELATLADEAPGKAKSGSDTASAKASGSGDSDSKPSGGSDTGSTSASASTGSGSGGSSDEPSGEDPPAAKPAGKKPGAKGTAKKPGAGGGKKTPKKPKK